MPGGVRGVQGSPRRPKESPQTSQEGPHRPRKNPRGHPKVSDTADETEEGYGDIEGSSRFGVAEAPPGGPLGRPRRFSRAPKGQPDGPRWIQLAFHEGPDGLQDIPTWPERRHECHKRLQAPREFE